MPFHTNLQLRSHILRHFHRHAYSLKNRTEVFRITADSQSDELRGMAASGSYRNGFVAQAKTSRSAIYKFPLCGGGESTVLDGGSLSHPYGLALYQGT